MFARILACLPAALVISALAVPAHAESMKRPPSIKHSEEALLGMIYDAEGVTFQVRTGGCTNKDSFNFNIVRDSKPLMVTLNRIVPDTCEAYIPNGIQLRYTYEEMAIPKTETISIMNPINPGVAIQQ